MVTFGLWLSRAFLDFDIYGTYAATNVGSVSDMRYRRSLLRQDLFRVSSADANNSGVDDGQKWDESPKKDREDSNGVRQEVWVVEMYYANS